MDKRKVERFWEHPGRYIWRFFLAVSTLCILLTYMPKWFNAICGIFLLVVLVKMIKKWENKEEKKQ